MPVSPQSKKVLLLQARDLDDPMLDHELACFRERIPHSYGLERSNLVEGPWDEGILSGYTAIMVGGSGRYGAAENEEHWFEPVLGLLRRVTELDFPLFCSCWGHEALAVALGGRVEVDADGYELGLLPVRLSDAGAADELFTHLPDPFVTPIGHTEQVVRLPEQATLLASTDRCRVQAYRIGNKPIYSTQFHPELSSERLWERVDAYIPHLRDNHRGADQACTDGLITRFLATFT